MKGMCTFGQDGKLRDSIVLNFPLSLMIPPLGSFVLMRFSRLAILCQHLHMICFIWMGVGFPIWPRIPKNGNAIMLGGMSMPFLHPLRSYVSFQCSFVDRDMMMRYHHFMGIRHMYSNAFRSMADSLQAVIHADESSPVHDPALDDTGPAVQVNVLDCGSDTASINTIDNGWQGWDDEDDYGLDDHQSDHQSDEEALQMDDMYGD